jgi:hypothetical protein
MLSDFPLVSADRLYSLARLFVLWHLGKTGIQSRDLRFSQRYWWGAESFGMWRCDVVWVVTGVSMDCAFSVFKRAADHYSSTVLPLKMKVSRFFETSRAPQPTTQRHISEDLAIQAYCSFSSEKHVSCPFLTIRFLVVKEGLLRKLARTSPLCLIIRWERLRKSTADSVSRASLWGAPNSGTP